MLNKQQEDFYNKYSNRQTYVEWLEFRSSMEELAIAEQLEKMGLVESRIDKFGHEQYKILSIDEIVKKKLAK